MTSFPSGCSTARQGRSDHAQIRRRKSPETAARYPLPRVTQKTETDLTEPPYHRSRILGMKLQLDPGLSGPDPKVKQIELDPHVQHCGQRISTVGLHQGYQNPCQGGALKPSHGSSPRLGYAQLWWTLPSWQVHGTRSECICLTAHQQLREKSCVVLHSLLGRLQRRAPLLVKGHDKWEQVTTTAPKAVGLNGDIRSYTFWGAQQLPQWQGLLFFLELENP